MPFTYKQIEAFVAEQTGERTEDSAEGPADLGPYSVWRVWTFDGKEYNAHYVIGERGRTELTLFENFQPFANWLMTAFNAGAVHDRYLNWLRNIIASIITLTLLALLVWAVLNKEAGLDYKWIAVALATTSLGYLMGEWVRRPGR